MKLGDFFKTATHCKPVNAKPVDITLVAKGPTLPSGEKNPPGRVMRARGVAAFVFVDAEQMAEARDAARRSAAERAKRLAGKGEPAFAHEEDEAVDTLYEILQRCLYDYDESTRTAGDPLFPSASVARSLVLNPEATRLVKAYNAYVASEHPEAPLAGAAFPGAGQGG